MLWIDFFILLTVPACPESLSNFSKEIILNALFIIAIAYRGYLERTDANSEIIKIENRLGFGQIINSDKNTD